MRISHRQWQRPGPWAGSTPSSSLGPDYSGLGHHPLPCLRITWGTYGSVDPWVTSPARPPLPTTPEQARKVEVSGPSGGIHSPICCVARPTFLLALPCPHPRQEPVEGSYQLSVLSFEAAPVLGTVYGYLSGDVVGPTLSIVVIGRASRALGTLLLLLLAATCCLLSRGYHLSVAVSSSESALLGAPQWQPLSPRLPLHLAG